jgi:SAM-dependent methyltransferase
MDAGFDEYGDIADLYDHVVPYRQRADVGFFVEAARAAGGAVLEVGCGTGRVLIPTARAGIEVTGVDLSARMLAVCRQRLAVEPETVRARARLVQADMRRFEAGQRFALATLPFRPFQHLLTVEDQLACLSCIHSHLVENGILIVDLFNPSLDFLAGIRIGEEGGEEPEFTMPDGRRVVRTFRVTAADRFNQVNDTELIYRVTHPDGRVERLVHRFAMRYVFRFEMEHLLARAGFHVERLYSDFDKHLYGHTYPGELIFVARNDQRPTTNDQRTRCF